MRGARTGSSVSRAAELMIRKKFQSMDDAVRWARAQVAEQRVRDRDADGRPDGLAAVRAIDRSMPKVERRVARGRRGGCGFLGKVPGEHEQEADRRGHLGWVVGGGRGVGRGESSRCWRLVVFGHATERRGFGRRIASPQRRS